MQRKKMCIHGAKQGALGACRAHLVANDVADIAFEGCVESNLKQFAQLALIIIHLDMLRNLAFLLTL